MGKRGPRGKIIPGPWAGLMTGKPPPIARDEASRILGAEIPEEVWRKIDGAIWWLNIQLWELGHAPRANANPKDRLSFEVWRRDMLQSVEAVLEKLRLPQGSFFMAAAARIVAMRAGMADRVYQSKGFGLGPLSAEELFTRLHEGALRRLDELAVALRLAEGGVGIQATSEAEARARCVHEIAGVLRDAELPVELTPRAVIDAARGTLNLEDLTPFERLVAALEVLPDRAPAALADAIRDALGKNCSERGEQFFPLKTVE